MATWKGWPRDGPTMGCDGLHHLEGGFDATTCQIDVVFGGDARRREESQTRWIAASDEAHQPQIVKTSKHGLGRFRAAIAGCKGDHHAFPIGAAQPSRITLCEIF